MARRDNAHRDLLCGLLAQQSGMITRDQLVAGFAVLDVGGGKTMADLLVEQGALNSSQRGLLDTLAAEHLAAHGGDPEKSLAALDLGRSTRASLAQIDDLDLESAEVGPCSTIREEGRDRAATCAVGTPTSDGQRFRGCGPTPGGAWAPSSWRSTPS